MAESTKTNKFDDIKVDEEEIKRLNQEMITSDLITPDRIYVDLILVKDFNISAILSFLKENKSSMSHEEYSETYNNIIAKLTEYNDRKFNDLAYIFPFMGVTNAQINERLHDEKCATWIIHHAPITKYINILRGNIAVNVNHSAVIGKRDPIELTINTYPLKLSKTDETVVAFYFADTLKVNVRVMYLDLKKATLSNFIKYDEIHTYFFKDLFSVEEIRKGYSELKFIKKRLFVAELFDDTYIPNKNTDKEGLYIKTYMDVLTIFMFVNPRLFSAPPIVTEKTENG